MQTLELLSPAKNLQCGFAAIDSGADAVYIGASRFGARAAAGNSVDDIRQLCDYAHKYGARVHVTVNTIIYDDEMDDTMRLVRQLCDIGVDALLVQDMGLLSRIRAEHLPVALHASTQCDTRTAEKAAWLYSLGFGRVVLAREMSADEITEIHKTVPDVELEAFVHGALCVSCSGVCYASQNCFDRSANRGECAQFCRLKFDLVDSDDRTIERGRYLLSLKDMCQIDNLETLARSGVTAFKIEGRLKDEEYVKNVVAAYSKRLDAIVARHPDKYRREAYGTVRYNFTPDLHKTFNRGYTTYFLNGRQPDIFSPDTPKALGEFVGHVKNVEHNCITVSGTSSFANGDGLCFLNAEHELEGFRVNRAVGNKLYPYKMPAELHRGAGLYRNNDQVFENELKGKSSERRIQVALSYGLTNDGFSLAVNGKVLSTVVFAHQKAKRPQHDNITAQLSKLGNTVLEASSVTIEDGAGEYFIPNSLLSQLRRDAAEAFEKEIARQTAERKPIEANEQAPLKVWQREYSEFPYLYNISNKDAEKFYSGQGMTDIRPAFELKKEPGALIMQCRHCLRYSLGRCVRRGGKRPEWHEPLFLRLPDGRRFRLEFNCDECQMNIYADNCGKRN